jgi:hypothetical protein
VQSFRQFPISRIFGCSDASWWSSGCTAVSPAGGTCPVATVVISGGGAGDQSAGSPEVKVPVGWVKAWSAPTRGASKSAGCKRMRTVGKPRNRTPPRESEGGGCWKCRDFPIRSKASVVGEGTGYKQPTDFPRSLRATCRQRTASESTEPLVGRLGTGV